MPEKDWSKNISGQYGSVQARIMVSMDGSTFRQELMNVQGATTVGEFADNFLDAPMFISIQGQDVYKGTMRSMVIDRMLERGLLLMKDPQDRG